MAEAIDTGDLLRPSVRVLVGVSGGLDSVVLLHALTAVAQWADRQYELIVAHLDHRLRDTSAGDAEFVAHLAGKLRLPCVIEQTDVRNVAQRQGQGIEHAARMTRYEFLARAAKQNNARAVATAHHADDNVETILFRILRGTGMRGLKGMEGKRELRNSSSSILNPQFQPSQAKRQLRRSRPAIRNISLLRPLLDFRRNEILAYAQAVGLTWREDHTNDDTRYRRNFLRHELLPLVREKLNAQADEALLRLGAQAGRVEIFLRRQAEERLARSVSHADSQKILIDVTMFAPDPSDETEAIPRTTAYRLILERLGMGQRDLTAEHLLGIDALLRNSSGVMNLPEDFSVRRERNQLIFRARDE